MNLNLHTKEDVDLEGTRNLAIENAQTVLDKVFEEYPETRIWHQHFLNHSNIEAKKGTPPIATWLYGKWMRNESSTEPIGTLENFDENVKRQSIDHAVTQIKAKAVEEIKTLHVDKKQQEDYVLTHNFEKVDTADEFDGVWRDFDGDDDLEKHKNALDELNMKFTVRVDDTVHSVYQADFIENANISESKEQSSSNQYITYPEWDYKKRGFRNDFCKVYPTKLTTESPNYYTETIKENATTLVGLRKMLANVNNKRQAVVHQTTGSDIDIDALTDMYVDLHKKLSPDEKVYTDNRKLEKDLSILLLLDISLSSDSYAKGNRILDVEKQVSILFGEVLNEYRVDFSIQSFYSKTRNYSTYQTLKGFDDSWVQARNRIGSVEACGFTRIGGALRHSASLLKERPSQKKWLVLLSDGKPNDYDRYEGKYGINDVKHAIREMREQHVNAYALAIDANARYYLPQMFGQNHFQILTNPKDLLKSLILFYQKIKQ